jgi:hypothetical protein
MRTCCASNWRNCRNDAGFDLALTGFDADELMKILAGEETTTEGHIDEDAAPEVPVTRCPNLEMSGSWDHAACCVAMPLTWPVTTRENKWVSLCFRRTLRDHAAPKHRTVGPAIESGVKPVATRTSMRDRTSSSPPSP